jgi:hypothetical protein
MISQGGLVCFLYCVHDDWFRFSIASEIGRGGKFIGRGSVLEPFSDFCWIEPAIFGIEKITRKFMVCFAGK